MSSASIQLAAVGIQDVYLYGKPEVSYFAGVFRRHSPFLLNSEEYPFNTPIQFGGSGYVKLPYKGDLLVGASLKLVLPPLFTPGPGWVYPLATTVLSNVNPYFNEYNYVDAATQALIRTNIPNFKVYFSDGANTISYAQRSVKYYNTYSPISAPDSVQYTGQLSSARLVIVTSSNTIPLVAGRSVTFPGSGIPNAVISNPYKLQNFDSGGVTFNYGTIDITFSTPYVFSPIYSPKVINVYEGSNLVSNCTVLSPTSVPWVRNDFISVTYDDPSNSWRWKSIYSLIKPFSNVYFNISSNTAPIPIGSNIIGLPFFTGNVTTTTAVTSSIVTPVNISSTEYISMNNTPRIPITINFNDQLLCESNLVSIQYPSQFDFSNLFMTFTNFKFKNSLSVHRGTDIIGILNVLIAPAGNIITSIDTVDPTFSSETSGTLFFGPTPLFNADYSNVVIGTPTTLEFTNVQVLKDTTIIGLPYKGTLKCTANSFMSNSVFTTFNSQQIIPVTSNVNVSFSGGGTGVVSYSFFPSPVTIRKIAFPTTQSAIFWGFDPAALVYTGARA